MALSAQSQMVAIAADGMQIEGMLEIPDDPLGAVLFAHGSGSSRFSPRNNYVAARLRQARFASLLVDLLSAEEDRTYQNRFDISLLSRRLHAAASWLRRDSVVSQLPIGLFGASTGAAAALNVAAQTDPAIHALVSRGGRPDLADEDAFARVRAPVLLIVGGLDEGVIELNRQACMRLQCEKQLTIVPGATHLFEEPGKLENVAQLAADWFSRHLAQVTLH